MPAKQRQTPVRVKDLPVDAKGIHLYCWVCGETYSATRGDYFMSAPNTVLKCCKAPMVLTRTVTREVEVDE